MRVILSTLIYLLTLRFRKRRSLELEIVALRHQLKILRRKRKHPPQMTRGDRCVWGCIYQVYPRARHWMQIVKPVTVIAWRDLGYHLGRPPSKGRPGRRPKVNDELRRLIAQMYTENTGWGFMHIHAELQKLGYVLCEQTVRVNLPRHRSPPGPGWRTFFQNHRDGAAAISVFALVAAVSFRLARTMIFTSLAIARAART
jgi:putative transposase